MLKCCIFIIKVAENHLVGTEGRRCLILYLFHICAVVSASNLKTKWKNKEVCAWDHVDVKPGMATLCQVREVYLPRWTAELLRSQGWNSSAGCPLASVTWLIVSHVGGKTWSQEMGGNRVIWGAANDIHHSSWPDWMLKKQENKCFLWNQRIWGRDNPRKWETPIPFSRWENRGPARWNPSPKLHPSLLPTTCFMKAGLFLSEAQKGPGI